MTEKDVWQRIIELVKDDKELHDAVVRAVNAWSASEEDRLRLLRERRKAKARPGGGTE